MHFGADLLSASSLFYFCR